MVPAGLLHCCIRGTLQLYLRDAVVDLEEVYWLARGQTEAISRGLAICVDVQARGTGYRYTPEYNILDGLLADLGLSDMVSTVGL